jgi:hypothetical protein
MKSLKSLFVLPLAFFLGAQARAGLNVPYTVDSDTMHLWHFNDPTNGNTEADAVAGNPIVLTNYGYPTSVTNGFTNMFLTNGLSVVSGITEALDIRPDDGASGTAASHAMAAGPVLMAATNFCNTTTGAFTFEALVSPLGPIFSSSAGGEWEIFCGDNTSQSTGNPGGRGWQFRLNSQSSPALNFNFLSYVDNTGTASDSFTYNLPGGTDAVAIGQWYHVAVTYTGYAPTNGDTANVLSFYWTLLDPTRTNADLLTTFVVSDSGTIGGTPSPAVGGSARTTHGVGNAGSFQGLIAEVRVSDIARSATNMAFNTNFVGKPPSFPQEPPANTFIGYGQTLTLAAVVAGSSPSLQWQQTNTSGGGFTNVPGQTNSALVINNATFGAAGLYRLVASNNIVGVSYVTNSSLASVSIGAAFSELYDTGVDLLGADSNLWGTPDLHYSLHDSADPNYLGPNAIVWYMDEGPIAAYTGLFANPDGVSQWIGPEGNGSGGAGYTSANGNYVFRTHFLLDSVDLTKPATLQGTWWENSTGTGILLNGVSTGISETTTDGEEPTIFTITNGFVPGLNTLDFVVSNFTQTWNETALRVEISGLGQALPAAKPVILVEPPAAQTVSDYNVVPSQVSFSVVAVGRPPLSYQWYADGVALTVPGATSRTLTYSTANGDAPTLGGQGTNFSVVVSNSSGAITSSACALTIVESDQPPVAPDYAYYIYTNQSLEVDESMLLNNASDPNGALLTFSLPSTVSTNGVNLTLTGDVLTYTPPANYVGADQFSYDVSDGFGGVATGNINILVLPLQAPRASSAFVSAGNIVLNGSGGAAGGSYHVLSTTDLTVPLTNWTAVGSGAFNGSGGFSFTNAISPSVPQEYYILTVP